MSTLLSPSSLNCERCHGHGFVRTTFGKVNCLECSGASPWTPASLPPASEPGLHGGHSISAWGVVVTEDGRTAEVVAYWPARQVWTATRMDGGEPADVEVTVTWWMELPELPLEEAA
jgi:hypothetical protein